jgi:uncharacterized damage-inducible protein DinB
LDAQEILMARTQAGARADLAVALVESYAVNDRMNQVVLNHLDPSAWRAKTPGNRGRTIAAVFCHMHNIRRKWIRLSAPHLEVPAPFDRARCSENQAKKALAQSAARCCEMIASTATFQRDGWAKPWPSGAAMVAYMIAHDAHHRGQVCMLAAQLGFPLPEKATSRMWAWERLWKECGFEHPR